MACLEAAIYTLAWAAGWRLYCKHCGHTKRFPWRQAISGGFLLGWLLMLLAATLLLRFSGGPANFHLFQGWREAWNLFTLQNWLNVLLNVALFLPLGILLPLVFRRFRRPDWTLLAGVGLSLAIESAQLFTDRGAFDVDDILNNSLGAILGWCLLMVVFTLLAKLRNWPRRTLAYGAFPLLCILVFGGVIGTYYGQDYGNLACAPTHRVMTRGVTVSLQCELPDLGSAAPVYYAAPYDRASSDAYADSLLEALGERDMNVHTRETIHYDTQAAYLQHATGSSLWVYYLDRTFSYSYHNSMDNNEPEVTPTDRETLERLLGAFSLEIPQGAEMTVIGNGTYQFTVDQYQDADYFYDGSVTCTYRSDGRLWRVENNLIQGTFQGQESIISPAEAVMQLENGHFLGEYTEHLIKDTGVNTITIDSISLTYQVDSKGYYQPVYLIGLYAGGNYDQILIPALA